MPTADGQFKGISLSGNAGKTWDKLFGQKKKPK